MKTGIGLFACIISLTLSAPAQLRTWTNSAGKTISAELVSFDAASGEVTLKLKSGKEYAISAKTLSPEDQAFLAEPEKEKAARRKDAGKTIKMFSTGDEEVPYHVYYPASYDPVKRVPPIAILFDPGGNGLSMVKHLRPSAEKAGWIVVGCDRLKNGMSDEESEPLERELLDSIRKEISFDPERVYFGGLSGGSLRAFNISSNLKGWKMDKDWKIAGMLSFGGWLGGGTNQDRPFQKNMAVVWINGDNDKGANTYVERDSKILSRRRCKTKLFDFPGGHEMPKDSKIIDEAITWLEKQAAK